MSPLPTNDNVDQTFWDFLMQKAEPFLPAIRIWGVSLFSRWIAMGYLTPADASWIVQKSMDLVAFGVPFLYSVYASWKNTRAQKLKTVNAIPGVLGIAVTPALDAKLSDVPTITTPDKLINEIRKAA